MICRFQVQHWFTWSIKFVTILSYLIQGNPNPATTKYRNPASELDVHSYLVIHVCSNFGTGQTPPKLLPLSHFLMLMKHILH